MAVQYYVAASLDGFIADADGGIGWLTSFGFDEFREHYTAFLSGVGAIVMGATTYEHVLRGGSWPYAETPSWVVTSRHLDALPGADLRLSADPIAAVQDARDTAGDADVWVIGGGRVAAQIADLELLDELHLTLIPVVLGAGTPLLPLSRPTRPLALLRRTPFESGAIELVFSLHAAG
ncbi:MAG: deaminase [Naasia sp.]|jgi:dihydrofolate reductase|uniref:dihydrofolate reductase family protein n=1 Tax=Naasia sp. TaxID=2546198 RepID=UPI0026233D9A|nr:dihydrofolate reductase family protein [Naasia sp.]MCU1571169.1 deaminase [Naasia sp.]